jgi:pimeloyl-ACP methyl ester carboxylesterase
LAKGVSMLLLQFLALAGLCYVGLVALLYFRQESFIFFPTKTTHALHGYSSVEDYQLPRGDIRLAGWLVNPRYADENILLYYGGNAEDIFLNIEDFSDIQAASLFVPYRGFGPNSGKPGEQELFADALAVFDDVRQTHPRSRITVIGRSLGSGVAVYVAAHRQVAGAVLITPFDTLENVAKKHYPLVPVSLLLKHRFPSLEYLGGIRCPVLVIYGGRDRVVPPQFTENLIRYVVGEKKVVRIDSADHGTIEMYPDFWKAMLEFIDRLQ